MASIAQAADRRAPLADEPEVISVTTTSARTELRGNSGTISDANCGKIYTWYADGGTVYAVFTTDGTSGAADDTASSGASVPMVFPSGVPVDLALPSLSGRADLGNTELYIACKTASGTAKLRYWPSSRK